MDKNQKLSVYIDTSSADYQGLRAACEAKAKEIVKEIELSDGKEASVPFWSKRGQELICVAIIAKDDSGKLSYHLDYSESTL